jgi:hypothetical protein
MNLYGIVTVLGTLTIPFNNGSGTAGLSFPVEKIQSSASQTDSITPQEPEPVSSGLPNKSSHPDAVQTDAGNANLVYRPGAGTLILAELNKSLDACKLKIGDKVEGILFQDLLYKEKIVVPRKSKVLGHVTEVVRTDKGQPNSRVGLMFEKVVLPDKRELVFPNPAIIVALAAPIRGITVKTTNVTDMPVQMAKGKDTGGAVLAAMGAHAQLAGANISSSTGAISAVNRGVIGIKNIMLDNNRPDYSVLISHKHNLQLDFDVQVLLQISSPKAPE